jgi:hypothetical protein
MRKCQRLCLVALLLPLVLPFASLSSAPAPRPQPVKKLAPRPIEVAFERIRLGMSEEEVFQLMAPFQKVFTGHGQWPRWTDGQFRVDLTLDISEFILMGRPIRVLEGELSQKRFDGQETHWVPVRRLAHTEQIVALDRPHE